MWKIPYYHHNTFITTIESIPVGLSPNHYKCSVNLSVHVADLVGFLTRDSLLTRTGGINTIFKTANFITM